MKTIPAIEVTKAQTVPALLVRLRQLEFRRAQFNLEHPHEDTPDQILEAIWETSRAIIETPGEMGDVQTKREAIRAELAWDHLDGEVKNVIDSLLDQLHGALLAQEMAGRPLDEAA